MIQRRNYRDYRVPAGRIFAPPKFRRALDLVPLLSEKSGELETAEGQSSDEMFGGAKLICLNHREELASYSPKLFPNLITGAPQSEQLPLVRVCLVMRVQILVHPPTAKELRVEI